jgi:hypothetical protein
MLITGLIVYGVGYIKDSRMVPETPLAVGHGALHTDYGAGRYAYNFPPVAQSYSLPIQNKPSPFYPPTHLDKSTKKLGL